jgi:hypothetical protein
LISDISFSDHHFARKSEIYINPILILRTPFGISKKEGRNMGKLVRMELIRTRGSSYESILPIQLASFRSKAVFHQFPFFIKELSIVHRNT